ncbi:endo alpha-1,4 polygalactosaminidase [Streptomyces sp. NPDC000983]|uniref:endo alpha-1,4 polygalactosaminidase n=1 Tax=Streptomyces sp. NPDC000983 TaxID=3154373 RepID=UPI0033258831
MRGVAPAAALLVLGALTGCSGVGGDDTVSGPRPSAAGTTSGNTPGGSSSAPPSRAPSTASAGPSTSPRPSSEGRWRPRPGLAWQWQLDGRVDPSVDVAVYDIDGFENSAADVARLHRAGRKVICYVNVGAREDFRPDRDAFPASVLGHPNGWEGERWLDIRRLAVLRPIMARRFDMCREKGFDAVEPDLVEGYADDTGFPLTGADQLRYNRMIAGLAHERGLAVGLKNDLAQIPHLVGDFDFAVNEECAQYDECEALKPFVEAGKAVFHVEYAEPDSAFCADSRRLGLSSMRKKLALGTWRAPC